jgi:alpha-tubulin suppressor-like RCC1 family protein
MSNLTQPLVGFSGRWRRASGLALMLGLALTAFQSSAQVLVPLTDITQVAAGGFHTCAVNHAGEVKCWGSNANGQLGDGTVTERVTPVGVGGMTIGVSAVAAGRFHTCALTAGGGVKCWGGNANGQLGDGTTTERLTPVDVSGLASGVSAIAAGESHTCALTTGGAVKCWGFNANGQLGDGANADQLVPVVVSGLTGGVSAIAAGERHTCALIASGGLKCWGRNFEGHLGDGTTTQRLTPVDVSGLTGGVSAIAAGGFHTCAVTTGGGAKCWGGNFSGQVGDGTTTRRLTPVDVSGLAGGAIAIAAGAFHTCAVSNGGALKCWGSNSGQIGDGTATERLTPVDVSGLTGGVSAIAVGVNHSCALTTAGRVQCWGFNANGQLGDATTSNRLTPTDASGLSSGVSAIDAGSFHTCAASSSGGVKCWGNNPVGQIGDGTSFNRITPVNVSGLTSGVSAITAGREHTCALDTSGGVKCWGNNSGGQLGDGSTMTRLTPTGVSGLTSGVSAIAARGDHTCALVTNGAIKCWGSNGFGQLGDGSNTRRLTPVDVIDLTSPVSAIAAGRNHTCALTTGGGVKCWGLNSNGQLGDGTTTQRLTPVDVSGLTGGVIAIAAAGNHTCALTAVGGVKCWGFNANGQLGDGTVFNRLTPVDVSGLTSGISTIAAGQSHTCSLTTGGGSKCWGNNSSGQLGNGSTANRLTPVDVSGLTSEVSAITAGSEQTCALTTGGVAKCWGSHQFGQLGVGGRSYLLPGDVLAPSLSVISANGFENAP